MELMEKEPIMGEDVDRPRLLQPVIASMVLYRASDAAKKLDCMTALDLDVNLYFCLKKLAELETDDFASKLLEDPKMVNIANYASKDMIITDLTLEQAVEVYMQLNGLTPPMISDFNAFLEWRQATKK